MDRNDDPLPELVAFLEQLAAKLRRHRATRQEAARLIGYQLMDPRLAARRAPRLTGPAPTVGECVGTDTGGGR